MKTATVLQHLAFEDLGLLAPTLEARGYHIDCHEVGRDGLTGLDPAQADLMVVLGGPVGTYETDDYPWLVTERALIARRLASKRPLLGICLGAQLIAEAAGGRVYPGNGKEIGWGALQLSHHGRHSPLASLEGVHVLHWHGDTYVPPPGSVHLARSAAYEQQAFQLGTTVLGLQFHLEVAPNDIERWLIGHACELSAAGIDLKALRADTRRYGARLPGLVAAVFDAWSAGWSAG